MLNKLSLFGTLVVALLCLSSCATNADVGNMTYEYHSAQKIRNSSILHNISVDPVTGGHETNPLWTSQINDTNFKEALVESLSSSKLFNNSDAHYHLNARLLELKQPLIGFNLTVNCLIHYKLFKQGLAKPIYDKDISSSYTAQFGDAVLATERLKKANEGAARSNIKNLIRDLYSLKG